MPAFVQQQQQPQITGMDIQNNYVSEIPVNPFIPPPIKEVTLRKIEKRQYVDLNELVPSRRESGGLEHMDGGLE